jgi:P27 family predicted phage terminase small subunit
MGLLESRHLDALEVYCRAWDSLHKSEATLKKDGEYVTAESGAMARHPAAINRDRARDDIRRYIIEFGGTPSSATSLRKDPAPKSGAVPNRKRDIG